MTERPILFSAPMVRAILEGRKTQTRRIVKTAPHEWRNGYYLGCHRPTETHGIHESVDDDAAEVWRGKCPFGTVGGRLWVREAWTEGFPTGLPSTYSCIRPTDFKGNGKAFYRADGEDSADGPQRKWRPSIHMPRWASRITLEITGVRVERLQDISEEDAIAEGCQCAGVPASLTNRGAFSKLWESINGPDSWAANPWVWVVEFRK